ncbi:GspH/FimT family pseudopilin [uncultured Microbulbifer sp.]|uniref:GspH/FimT family pseudopilin n=1 Tax=uncultured Microbulbifer sp. TaxID=348147 RepID=UPI0025F1F5AB|nr:GspH/FimT family pseudopilin [uncultured Microbulbifer sp.]
MGFKQRGLTLIELMVTLAVLAIIVAIAVPNFNTMIANNRALTLGEDLATALNFARTEAVKRGARVSLCGSTDGASCDGGFANNWLVVVDSAASDDAAAVTVDTVLRQWQAPGANETVAATQGGNAVSFIRFTRKGMLGRSANGAVTVNASASGCTTARDVTVGLAGLLNMGKSTSGCS